MPWNRIFELEPTVWLASNHEQFMLVREQDHNLLPSGFDEQLAPIPIPNLSAWVNRLKAWLKEHKEERGNDHYEKIRHATDLIKQAARRQAGWKWFWQ